MTSSDDPIAQQLRVPRILWLAIMMSTVAVFVVVAFVAPVPAEPFDPLFLAVFSMLALLTSVVHFVFPALRKKQILAATQLATTEVADPNASVIFRESAPRIRVFVDANAVAAAGKKLLEAPLILSLALAEAIGFYGTGLVTLGCPVTHAAVFPACAVLLMARLFPTRKSLLAPLEAHFEARLVSDQPAKSQ